MSRFYCILGWLWVTKKDSDGDIKVTKEMITQTKKALAEDGIKMFDMDEFKTEMREKHGLEPKEIVMGVLTENELFYNVLGSSYCGNCNEKHERGISLDSDGNVLREIKPEYIQTWTNASLYKR